MEIEKRAVAIAVVRQAAILPEPRRWMIHPAVMPCPWREDGAVAFDKHAPSPIRIDPGEVVCGEAQPALAEKYAREAIFIERNMLRLLQKVLPALYRSKSLAIAPGVAKNGEMSRDDMGMGRQHVAFGQKLVRVNFSDVAKDHI